MRIQSRPSEISADYYILLNSDVEVTDNWITPVIEVMEKDKSIAVPPTENKTPCQQRVV